MCIVLSHFLMISYGAVEEYYSKVETRFYVNHDGILLFYLASAVPMTIEVIANAFVILTVIITLSS